MNKDTESLIQELSSNKDENINTFSTDQELVNRAIATANNQQAGKDLAVLGIASIWVVLMSMFTHLAKPLFKIQQVKNKGKTNESL